jgi:hypothetical protein
MIMIKIRKTKKIRKKIRKNINQMTIMIKKGKNKITKKTPSSRRKTNTNKSIKKMKTKNRTINNTIKRMIRI